MALSTRRSRRSQRDIEATEPLLTFQLRQQWFALPLIIVQKVMALDPLPEAADPNDIDALVPGQNITILDINRCIFPASAPDIAPSPTAAHEPRCFAILESPHGEQLGLPLDSQPKMRRVPVSQLAPLSADTIQHNDLRGIIAQIPLDGDPASVFLLDPEYLQGDCPEAPDNSALLEGILSDEQLIEDLDGMLSEENGLEWPLSDPNLDPDHLSGDHP